MCFSGQAAVIDNNPEIVIGHLENGLTYYIAHNGNPKGCADFYIAHNVGALQEEDSQNGLAHFLEHMAFNGTEHYPDKELLNFLAKDGVRFGYNVNAYTSRNETVYNISSVPLVRESFVDSVLMVLHDWSCAISCEQEALDAERGVISEEWRLADEQRRRMMQKQTELIYKGSKQPERTVLGSMEVINGFKREDILDFYHKWYRPDMQAIIVVGDFDVAEMEVRIRTMFSDIRGPENPEPKQHYMPEPQDGPLFGNQTDPQISYHAVKVIYKAPFPSREQLATEEAQQDYLSRLIISSVMQERLKEKCRGKDSRVPSIVCVSNTYDPDYYITLFTASPKDAESMDDALEICDTEIRRMIRFGISRQEFEVARLNVALRLHFDHVQNDADTQTKDVVTRCLENFLRGYPCVRPAEWQNFQKTALDALTYEQVNEYPRKMFDTDEVIYSNCLNVKEENDAPSVEEMKAVLAANAAAELEPEYLEYPDLDLNVDVAGGSIAGEKSLKDGAIKEWTLSNGAKVYFLHSAEKGAGASTIMEFSFDSGYRSFRQGETGPSRAAYAYLRRNLGMRGCERGSFKNYPSLYGINSIVGSTDHSRAVYTISAMKGKTGDAFRAAYIQLTEPYFGKEKDVERYRKDQLHQLSKPVSDRIRFSRHVDSLSCCNHPWRRELDSAAYQAVSLEMLSDVFHRLYGDFSNMSVFICSDCPEEEIRGYVEKYVASLSSAYPYKVAKDTPDLPSYGRNVKFYRTCKPVSAPLSAVDCRFRANVRLCPKNRAEIEILDYIMSARYLDQIREKRGGAYHVGFATDIYSETGRLVESRVEFQTRPELRDLLVNDVYEELGRMCEYGPSEKEMDVAVKYLKKRHSEKTAADRSNIQHQLDNLKGYVRFGTDFGYDYNGVVDGITAADIRKLARKIASGNRMTAVYTEE